MVVVDDFSRGSPRAVERVQGLAGRSCDVVRADVADVDRLVSALEGVDVVVHLAAFKRVGESMEAPERYFWNNLGGMAALLEAMTRAGVERFVYSSSASVYGTQRVVPISEDAPLRPDSPYGASKLRGEEMLDWMVTRRGWSVVSLRYFNPVGAHASGRIGEPIEDGSNLFPRVLAAYSDADQGLRVFGTDYDTPDGTCLRDYIHVCDLSRAHLVALDALKPGAHAIYNVGTGRPHSVREVLNAFAEVHGEPVPATDGPRRPGDPESVVADPSRFRAELGYEARLDLHAMVSSALRWWSDNPKGYG